MLVVLDTSVLIDFLRGRPVVERVRALRVTGRVAATTAVNVDELARGRRPGEGEAIRGLLSGLVLIEIDHDAAWLAGTWRRDAAATGRTLWQADCLIGAASQRRGATLATGNPKDFALPGLQVEHWPVGV